jgi:ribosomal-protein-alanine N-acetyltransferase
VTGLRLESLTVLHAPAMYTVLSDPAIYEFLDERRPESLDAVQERYRMLERGWSSDGKERWLNWIARLESGECAGFVQATVHTGGTADFAFVFGTAYQGKGIAHAASTMAIPILRDNYEVREMYATADARNARSIRLLARLGFEAIEVRDCAHGTVDPGDVAFRNRLGAQAAPT